MDVINNRQWRYEKYKLRKAYERFQSLAWSTTLSDLRPLVRRWRCVGGSGLNAEELELKLSEDKCHEFIETYELAMKTFFLMLPAMEKA